MFCSHGVSSITAPIVLRRRPPTRSVLERLFFHVSARHGGVLSELQGAVGVCQLGWA